MDRITPHTGSFADLVRNTETPSGTAAMWWLGQMGLLVKIGDVVLCIDYYAAPSPKRQILPPVPVTEMQFVDLFLGTHDHIDHIDHPSWKIWADTCPDAQFIIPELHRQTLLDEGFDNSRLTGLNEGLSFTYNGVTVHAIAAAHEFLNQDAATGLYPCLQYIIEGNGIRLYHAGDTLRYDGMRAKLQAFGHIDAAILPINGRDAKRYRRNTIGNMTFQEAVDLAGELQPGVVIPGHWDMFAHNSADPAEFADYLDAKYEGSVPCLLPDYLETIKIPFGS
ncbi:MAG: MBL fold metallo-hydrolase [Eubacterium sp.]|nr:MBL fold metallo-hydrolase [Eubacterium sp.]